MAKTYLDILNEKGIKLFLSPASFDAVLNFNPKTQYAVGDQVKPVFKSHHQQIMELGKTSTLIADMCWYGATEEELVRAIKHGMVVVDAEKLHLDWRQSEQDHGIDELRKKYRRFYRRPKLTEREKLVITAYTGYVLEGTAGKIDDFLEEILGHSIHTSEPPKTPLILEVHRALKEEFIEICRKHHFFDYI